MHIIRPELIPMWDKEIRYAYGQKDDAEGFIEFMKLMKEEVIELLESCKKLDKSKEQICKELSFDNEKRSLLRLVDAYSYILTRPGYLRTFKSLWDQKYRISSRD